MSLFVDTGVFYAHQHDRASRHATARGALEAVLSGRFGRLYTSTCVHDESVTLVRKRTGAYEDAITVSDRILGNGSGSPFSLLYVDEQHLQRSRDVFRRYSDHDLSFTDATTIAFVEAHDVDSVLSFDDDFDGIVDRVEPADLA